LRREGQTTEVCSIPTNARGLTHRSRACQAQPIFHARGTVTAGNSCPMSDGAAAVVLMSRDKAREMGLKPMGVFRAYAVAGVEPELMGIGPVAAVPRALGQAGITLPQVDLIELNEAFASQALLRDQSAGHGYGQSERKWRRDRPGPSTGLPGAYLTTKLLHEMERRRARFGMVTMCVGGGMGAAGIFEREE